MPKTKSKRKCAACKSHLTVGELVVRLRLKKRFQAPCSTCGHLPPKLKYFHEACAPTDINAAMGFDPNAGATVSTSGGAVPPPPKPVSAEDAALAALASLEHAVIIRAARKGVTPEMEKAFKTFQGIKARVLRPGTVPEGEVATHIALKRIIDLVYA
jgi:hypothetical protein